MKKDIKILTIIISTLLLMFATSLLLDLQIVKAQMVRKLIVYIAISLWLLIGFLITKYELKK